MVDQSGITVQITEEGTILMDVDTDSDGDYFIAQVNPGDHQAYIKLGDPGPGTPDTLKSSTRVRWRRSPSVSFIVEGGLATYPDDLTRYTLYQAKLSSWDSLAGFVFMNAANSTDPLVVQEDSADIFVKRNGDSGVSFGTTGYQFIFDVGDDSLEVGSAVPGSGYQETYSFSNAPDCIGGNYVVKCRRNGRHAKIHILDADLEHPFGDSLSYPYITFLSFYLMSDTTDFPPIASE